jgi:phosphotransferase system enzyme I (PtsI)
MMLDRPELFLNHLRALLRASTRKNVRIMFPMISSVQEVRSAREFVRKAKEDLRSRGQRYDQRIKLGVMIEVPSAAIQAEEIAGEVDFFSIGTNDLIQYLLAVDRDNTVVAPLYQQFHPAVIRTIKLVVDAAHKKHLWVGMCGEMAGDPLATMLLVGLGLDELSMGPSVLPEIKKIVRSVRYREARRVAEKALAMPTAEDVRRHLVAVMREKLPDIPIET